MIKIIIIRLIVMGLPLIILQWLGILLGKLFHKLRPGVKKILIKNIINSKIYSSNYEINNAINNNISETGKTIVESLAIWVSSKRRILDWVHSLEGEAEILKAQKKNKGIIFLTPHLGCYEIAPIYYGASFPITLLYRPSRKKWLNDLMIAGRKKGLVRLAPTSRAGIKAILLALQKREAVGILPDQVANKGEGVWAPFFNRPALTMTLVGRLVKKTNATVIMVFAERMTFGRGFIIHFETIEGNDIDTPGKLNFQLEKQIKKNPMQYLWNYDRHKGHESQ